VHSYCTNKKPKVDPRCLVIIKVDRCIKTSTIEIMEQTVKQDTQQLVEKALENAEQMRQGGKLADARDLLIEMLQYGHETGQIYYRLGNIYFDEKDYDKAEYTFRRAIDQDQHHINAHHNLSVVYRKQGRVTESLKQRKKAGKIARQHPEKIEFTKDQMQTLRGFARKTMWVGLGVVGAIVLLILIFLR